MNIRENLLEAIALVEAEPEQLVDLSSFVQEGTCGTLHCTLGLIAASGKWPEIQLVRDVLEVGGDCWPIADHPILNRLFGHAAYAHLFKERGGGRFDTELLEGMCEDVSDKDLAIKRLRAQLALYPRGGGSMNVFEEDGDMLRELREGLVRSASDLRSPHDVLVRGIVASLVENGCWSYYSFGSWEELTLRGSNTSVGAFQLGRVGACNNTDGVISNAAWATEDEKRCLAMAFTYNRMKHKAVLAKKNSDAQLQTAMQMFMPKDAKWHGKKMKES